MIQNAQEATNDDGEIEIRVTEESHDVLISIKDTGCGMSEEFIKNRLFKPFDTTKGNAGMGIGVYQSRETIEGFGGALTVSSKTGQGSQFVVRLTKADQETTNNNNTE